MKKIFASFLFVSLVLTIVLVSCKNEDEPVIPTPETKVDTNYLNMDGTKYVLTPSSDLPGTLRFYGTPNGGYPLLILDFDNTPVPTSTGTYTCIVKVEKVQNSAYYEATKDLKIDVNNGVYSITLPSMVLTNTFNTSLVMTCFGNITVKQ